MGLKGPPVLTAISELSYITPPSWRTLSPILQEMGAVLVGHDYNRNLLLQQCRHQYKSVIDTLTEEEELPYTAARTLFDADTDLWHMGSTEPLSQRGLVNQGHFVGFRCSKELHIYNRA